MSSSEAPTDEKDSNQLQFRGQDATECRRFIAALLKVAFARGKQRDDQWMAEFAATCMEDDALVWWSELDEEIQGSWKLLRQAMRAMRSEYRPMFHGGSGEEAETFVRAVRDKAVEEGKRQDNEWIVTYVESCLTGEALRWHAYLDSNTKNNWEKLQQALLTQYPRDGAALNLLPTPPAAASLAPAANTTRRGRIRISSSSCSTHYYMSKHLQSRNDNRIFSTTSLADALEVEWSTGSDGVQTLSIPGSQIPGYDVLGIKWNSPYPEKHNSYLAICPVDSQTHSTSLSSYSGNLLTKNWKISPKDGRSDGTLTVSVEAGKRGVQFYDTAVHCNDLSTSEERVYAKWDTFGTMWFCEDQYWPTSGAEFIFEPI